MSHYAVAVITDGAKYLDEILAPYDEAITVAPYISRTKEEIINDAKKWKEAVLKRIEDAKESDAPYEPNNWEKTILGASTDEDFYNAEINEDSTYDGDGNELSTYNPNSKWDWWVVGGRFSGMLKAKKGFNGAGYADEDGIPYPEDEPEFDEDARYDCLKIKDIDFMPDKDAYDRALKFWEEYIEKEIDKRENGLPYDLYSREYYKNRYTDKEDYARKQAAFTTYSVVTPDGVWHEPGQMGWFGISSESDEEYRDWVETYKEKFIDKQNPENYFVIIDCHI